MSLIKSKIASTQVKLINLQVTTKLTPKNIILPELKFLNDELESIKDDGTVIAKTVWAILNSILTQKRVCFTLSRGALREMLKADENGLKIGLKNDSYRQILSNLLDDSEGPAFIKLIHEGNRAYAYEVVHPTLLAFLIVDVNKQRQEAIAFSDADTTSTTDVSVSLDDEDSLDDVPATKPIPEAKRELMTKLMSLGYKEELMRDMAMQDLKDIYEAVR